MQFQLPEVAGVNVYLVRLSDGRVVARTEEELKEAKEKSRSEGKA